MLPNISPAEALKMLQDNKARLVDVREADELAALRVFRCRSSTRHLSFRGWICAPPPLNSPSYLPVRQPHRGTAITCCKSLRLAPRRQMEGGVSAWAKQGLPVETSKQTCFSPDSDWRWRPGAGRCA